MCGIVGAVSTRPVGDILVNGLRSLEYRGYDSAGVSIIDNKGAVSCVKRLGKVDNLAKALSEIEVIGTTGIGHTRWATHGAPSERNAHPHHSRDRFYVVHNGIIENHDELRNKLLEDGYAFESDTDTEVIVHLIAKLSSEYADLRSTVQAAVQQLDGAYGMVVLDRYSPDELVVSRSGSPIVIGFGYDENFVASDPLALLQVTRSFSVLDEGDIAHVTRNTVSIYNHEGLAVTRDVSDFDMKVSGPDKGGYKHYMLKEIYEQPEAIQRTLDGRIDENTVLTEAAFGAGSCDVFNKVKHVQIVACGTSYNAGLVARQWIEEHVGISCNVEIASEFRYRKSFVHENSLLVTLSQSGETADTLAALSIAQSMGYMASLTICNVEASSLVRESDLAYLMNAGPEIGVASTKAFTVQLTALLMMCVAISQEKNENEFFREEAISALSSLPDYMEQALKVGKSVEELAEKFADKHHVLFLGRGEQYPIAIEGALKLKEISYIHAEAYAAGELKHGPLALIDDDMPVVVIAPTNEILDKLKSNIEEVRARGSVMFVFADEKEDFVDEPGLDVVNIDQFNVLLAPILFSVPLQLLSYYVALIKGTDVDQPRNLAKSVTVE